MPLIHTWQDIVELGGDDWLTAAEQQLIAACVAGELCVLGDGQVPPEGSPVPDRKIRADVLRYLITGGCEAIPVRGWGVQLRGGHITGRLDLSFARAKGFTGLAYCRFDQGITARQTRFELLNLSNSVLHILNAQGAQVTGDVFLRDITATGEVSLNGMKIGGQFDCTDATFAATKGDALNAQDVQVTGGVFLRNINATGVVSLSGVKIGGQLDCTDAIFAAIKGIALNAQGMQVTESLFLRDITATGEVSLNGAKIGGQLNCTGATFAATNRHALDAQRVQITGDVFLRNINPTGEVSLSGAEIGGQLDCTDATFAATKGDALNAQRMRVGQGLIWRYVKTPSGGIDFASAHVSDLADDVASWPDGGRLYLDGFTYDRISGAFTDARTRIKWLEKGSTWDNEFFPQPFTHLAKVLREMGHDGDARAVLYRHEQLVRKNIRARAKVTPNGDIDVGLRSLWWDGVNFGRWLWDWVQRRVIGYGHHPLLSFGWLVALILFAGVFAHLAYDEGSFAPNSGPVLVSQDWKDFADLPDNADPPNNPAELWSVKGAPGQDWETFYAGAWAADLVIPIVDLGQTDAWAPSTTRGPWGWHLWWLRWVFILTGWVVTALGAAALTGVIRRD